MRPGTPFFGRWRCVLSSAEDWDAQETADYSPSRGAVVTVSGGKQAFSAYGPSIIKAVDVIMARGAGKVRDIAVENAPVGNEEHRASAKYDGQDGGGPGMLAGSHKIIRVAECHYQVGNTAYYAGWVHDGTAITHEVAQPWLQNAFNEAKTWIVHELHGLRSNLEKIKGTGGRYR